MRDIRNSFEYVHLYMKVYQISTTTLWFSKTVIMLIIMQRKKLSRSCLFFSNSTTLVTLLWNDNWQVQIQTIFVLIFANMLYNHLSSDDSDERIFCGLWLLFLGLLMFHPYRICYYWTPLGSAHKRHQLFLKNDFKKILL